ncbi:MAG: hypothetical protein J5787_03890 [Alphaproteobacteria bacterium]|nr:hypothetical protein [Alphaproteobacteria bacterium]
MSDETEQGISPEDRELLDLISGIKTEITIKDFQQVMVNDVTTIINTKEKTGYIDSDHPGTFDISQIIPSLNKGENYCQGTFSHAWLTALDDNSITSNTLDGSRTVKGEVSTNGAIESFDKYEWKEYWPDKNTRKFLIKNNEGKFVEYNAEAEQRGEYAERPDYKWKDCTFSIKDYPEGTTLRDMLWEGYNSNPQKIQEGALVLAPRKGNSNSLHAMMFMGFDNSKPPKPIFTYANNERKNSPDNGYWTKYTADNNRCRAGDCYVVNMPKVASIEISEAENEHFQEKGRDQYVADFIKYLNENPYLKDKPELKAEYLTQLVNHYKEKDPAYAEQISAFARGEITELSSQRMPQFELNLPAYDRAPADTTYYYTRFNIHNDVTVPRLANIDAENVGTTSRENGETERSVSQTLQLRGNVENESIGNGIRHTISGNTPVTTTTRSSDRTVMTPTLINQATSRTF